MSVLLLFLLGCTGGVGIVGIDGFPDTGVLAVDCPAGGELTARATQNAVLPRAGLEADGRLPVTYEGEVRRVGLELTVDLPVDFGRARAALRIDGDGTPLSTGDVAEAGALVPGRPCWSRFGNLDLVVPPEVAFDGMPFELDLSLTTDDQTTVERTLPVLGSDPFEQAG